MNPNSEIEYPKNQYKKFIKDVVSGTLERAEPIEEQLRAFKWYKFKQINY